jgi:hypothetical protein
MGFMFLRQNNNHSGHAAGKGNKMKTEPVTTWTTWHKLSCKSPEQDRRGWNFPYSGGDWPAEKMLCVCYAPNENGYMHTSLACWLPDKMRFTGGINDNVMAWRKPTKKDNENAEKYREKHGF